MGVTGASIFEAVVVAADIAVAAAVAFAAVVELTAALEVAVDFEFKFNGTSDAILGLPIGAPALPSFKAAMSSRLGYWFSNT